MYGSNPLSVFVSIFIALNLAIERTSRLRFSDIVLDTERETVEESVQKMYNYFGID